MLAAFVTVFLFLVWKHAGPVLGALLVFAATLSFYKLGQQQFFLFFFLVTPFAIRYLISATTIFTPQVMVAFLAWIGFLNWYQLEYSLTCSMLKGPAHHFRYWGGLFYFLFSAVLAWMLFRAMTAPETRPADSLTPS
jgi:multisubunit Na+/H+ antiporter MnhG subunit